MESTKNKYHHHQLQAQNAGCSSSSSSSSSSSLATPSDYYGVGTTINAWSTTPTSFLETSSGFTLYPSEPILSSRQPQLQENTSTLSQYMNSSMEFPAQLVFHNWANTTSNFLTTQSIQDLQPPRIKEESSEHYYPEHTDLLTSNERKNRHVTEMGMNIMLKFSQSEDLSNKILPRNLLYPRQILQSENVSSLNQMGTVTNVESLDMNIEGLDFLTSSSFGGNFGVSLEDRIGILRDGFPIYSAFDDHMQQCNEISFYGSSKIPDPVGDGSMEAKHSSTTMAMEEKAPLRKATKKSRLEGRASCLPFKVRREKLGDRIAALQQLVAPFGKTDTATVLKEAIECIKFLQDQVETLSMPYMKASRNKSNGAVMADPMGHSEKKEEPKGDMRSRGLCLVPLSCFSYITQGGGGAVWPPPHFGDISTTRIQAPNVYSFS